ncbi:MAG: hypothetical protein ACKO8U_17140, partial [Pirellula sp.]
MFLKILRQSNTPAISSTKLRSIGKKSILTSFMAKIQKGNALWVSREKRLRAVGWEAGQACEKWT